MVKNVKASKHWGSVGTYRGQLSSSLNIVEFILVLVDVFRFSTDELSYFELEVYLEVSFLEQINAASTVCCVFQKREKINTLGYLFSGIS